jgi:hypothetical protein
LLGLLVDALLIALPLLPKSRFRQAAASAAKLAATAIAALPHLRCCCRLAAVSIAVAAFS